MERKNVVEAEVEPWLVYVNVKAGYRKLVAMQDLRQGKVIAELPTELLDKPDRLSIEYPLGVHRNCEFSVVGSINHSCEPNAAVFNGNIVAWSCIAAGEEVTINYKRTERHLAEPFDCHCGSKKCIGRVE